MSDPVDERDISSDPVGDGSLLAELLDAIVRGDEGGNPVCLLCGAHLDGEYAHRDGFACAKAEQSLAAGDEHGTWAEHGTGLVDERDISSDPAHVHEFRPIQQGASEQCLCGAFRDISSDPVDLRTAVRRFLASGTEGRRPSQTSNSAIAALDAVEDAMKRDISSDPVDDGLPPHWKDDPPHDIDEWCDQCAVPYTPPRDISRVTGSERRIFERHLNRVVESDFQYHELIKDLDGVVREAVDPWRKAVQAYFDAEDAWRAAGYSSSSGAKADAAAKRLRALLDR